MCEHPVCHVTAWTKEQVAYLSAFIVDSTQCEAIAPHCLSYTDTVVKALPISKIVYFPGHKQSHKSALYYILEHIGFT